MSKGSRAREIEYGREERRSRASDNSTLEARVYLGGINAKNFSFREIQDWMSKYGKVLDVVFCERHILVQFDRESEATRAIDREKGGTFRGVRFDIRFAHSSDGSMSSRSEVPRSRSPRTLPYDRSSRDMSPGFRETARERSPIDRDRYYKERRGNSPEYRGYDRSRVSTEERARSNTRVEYPSSEYQEPNWNAPSLTNKVTAERPGFDAAIIVMSSDLLNYAETIESKLQRQIALTTHIIVLKEESHANACIEDLNNKAVLYAFLVNHMNEKHLSCTLRILYGNGQEHRNMLLTNALTFVSRNFEDYQKRVRELKSIAPKPNYDPSRMPPGFLAPDDKTIYQLHLLADSRMLTIEELNEVGEFIQKRIQVLAQAEGIIEKPNPIGIISNDSKGMISGIPNVRDEKALIAQQNQLHSKILNILKPSTQSSVIEKESINSGMDQFSNFNNESITAATNNPLTNPKVQQALDSLMQSKFRPNVNVHDQTEDNSHSFSSVSQQSNQYAGSNMLAGMNTNMNPNMNSNMNANMNTNLSSNINSSGMGMNPNMNMNSAMNMNQGMNMTRAPNSMNPQVRSFQPGHPYASNYPGYFQPTQVGQPVYRARAPFQQPRPQYPGY